MKKQKRFFTILTVFGLLFGACIRRPDGVESDKKMASVLADMELAEAWLQSSSSVSSDENREAIVRNVLNRHGLSQEQFDSTLNWYLRNPDSYYELCDLTEKELKKKQKRLSGKAPVVEVETDLWPYSGHVIFSNLSNTDGLIFSVPAEETDRGSQFVFKMRFMSQVKGTMNLAVEYSDGSYEFVNQRLSNTNKVKLKVISDTSQTIKRVFGNVNLDNLNKGFIWSDSVSLVVLPFDSTQYYNRHSQRMLYPPVKKIDESKKLESDSLVVNP